MIYKKQKKQTQYHSRKAHCICAFLDNWEISYQGKHINRKHINIYKNNKKFKKGVSKIADKAFVQRQLLNMQQDRKAYEYFKDKINNSLKELDNAKKYIKESIIELKKAYSGQVVKEKTTKLENDIQQINNIERELQNSIAELNQRIGSLNSDISVKETEYRSL